jgi:hypothetical protein
MKDGADAGEGTPIDVQVTLATLEHYTSVLRQLLDSAEKP